MVSTNTATSGAARVISRVAAKPSWPGICRSSTATFGRCSTTSAHAPHDQSAATPTTSMPCKGSEQGGQTRPHHGVIIGHARARMSPHDSGRCSHNPAAGRSRPSLGTTRPAPPRRSRIAVHSDAPGAHAPLVGAVIGDRSVRAAGRSAAAPMRQWPWSGVRTLVQRLGVAIRYVATSTAAG